MKLTSLLTQGREFGASDIHVVVGLPPLFRVQGEIVAAQGDSITEEDSRALAYELLNNIQKERFAKDLGLSFSARFGDQDRARITLYLRNGCPELSIRLGEREMRTRDELRLPRVVDELAREPNGLVLITGPTGSGKTTTFHYMIDLINAEARKKIITIEDPIEYAHRFKRSIIVQQEVLADVHDFPSALRLVLRQDPDVIGIGELRDRETMYTALMAAETGHLVVATLHTPGAMEVIQRLSAAFPESEQEEVRYLLAGAIRGVIAQQLLPLADGSGRTLCPEVLIGTNAVRKKIRDNQTHLLYSEMQAGGKHQMLTLDHSLLALYQAGDITYETAVGVARYPDQIRQRMA